jgi:hypothetical protein
LSFEHDYIILNKEPCVKFNGFPERKKMNRRTTIFCSAGLVMILALTCGCSRKNMYKGNTAERIDQFSRVDDSLEEKHIEDTGGAEYIK